MTWSCHAIRLVQRVLTHCYSTTQLAGDTTHSAPHHRRWGGDRSSTVPARRGSPGRRGVRRLAAAAGRDLTGDAPGGARGARRRRVVRGRGQRRVALGGAPRGRPWVAARHGGTPRRRPAVPGRPGNRRPGGARPARSRRTTPGGPAAGLVPAAWSGRLGGRTGVRAGSAGVAVPWSGGGVDVAALLGALRRLVGVRRPGRPRRAGPVERRARRGIHPGQPAARGRAGAAGQCVTVPAGVAAVRQSALPADRADPRVRPAADPGTGAVDRVGGAVAYRPAGRGGHRPGPGLDGETGGAGHAVRGAVDGGAAGGVPGVRGPGGAVADRLRDLVRPRRTVRPALAGVARRAAGRTVARGRRRSRATGSAGRVPPLAAVVARRTAGIDPGGRAGRRNAAGRGTRPGRRRGPRRGGRLDAPGRVRRRGHGRRTPG